MPKHGSWLNAAEIEIGVMQRECFKMTRKHELTGDLHEKKKREIWALNSA
jgi:hypothetical protein